MPELKVACLLAQGFEDSEFSVPYDRLRSAGFRVDVVGSREHEELKGYRGKETVYADRGIDDVEPEDYAALLIPGGYSPDHLRADPRFVAFVKAFEATGGTVAAVCHGPQLLISAELVRGRTLTAWKTVQDDLRQIGAIVLDEPVVTDRNWITSRQPSDLHAFSDALIEALRAGHRESGIDTERQRRHPGAPSSAPGMARLAAPRIKS
jgi:protease I